MKNLYLFIAFCLFSVGYAQNPADLIENFRDNGLPPNYYYYYKNNPGNASLPKVAVQSDGKILINSGNGLERISIMSKI